MRLSNTFFITRREFPKDEETLSARYLIRSGMIYKNEKGIYSYLPFGNKVVENIKNIIKEEFDKINANQVIMPTLVPSTVFEKTGRKELFNKEMYNLKDRNNREYSLCPTSEELFAELARHKIMSYKDLHFTLYQIGTKYRDEEDLKCGLSRKKEFTMADAYSFDANDGGSDISYDKMYLAFKNIFTKMGLNPMVVRSDALYMKGLSSEEFQVISEHGDNTVVKCNNCTFASNIEDAACKNNYKLYSDKLNRNLGNDYIAGKGEFIATQCLEKGVDPYVAVAIILHETGCGTKCSNLARTCNNVGGQKGSPGCNGGSFKSFSKWRKLF